MTTLPYPGARALLKKHGLHAKKAWSQNFLIDERVFDAVVRAATRTAHDWIVEIGAGLGTLTARLAMAVPGGRVLAVERDRDMLAVLAVELAAMPNVNIIAEDALAFDYAAAAARAAGPVAVAGNLPYQIAAPLIFAILAARQHVSHAVVMIQKEMGDRIVASPGTPEYGAMGVMVRTYADARVVTRVRAGSFVPAPKVASVVLELTPLATTRAQITDEKHYSRVVHAAFGQRRKTLRNALRSVWSDEVVDRGLQVAAVDGRRRGETLSVEEFALLANALEAHAGAA